MSLTNSQKTAIAARGNVLVVAGAGTGKTKTLVERCLSCLLDASEPASIDELLVVTFTDAAASEVRQRIRAELERLARQEQENKGARKGTRWQEQLALFETAYIGTLHSFCLRLIKQHFYELGIDPQLAVLPEEEAALLATETLDVIFNAHYSGEAKNGAAVQDLILSQGGNSDKLIRSLVLRLHHYSQTLPDPSRWLEEQIAEFSEGGPGLWNQWLQQALAEWRARWKSRLDACDPANTVAQACRAALAARGEKLSGAEAAEMFRDIDAARENCPNGKKTAWVTTLKAFFDEAEFLASLCPTAGKPDPLTEDWNWVRGHMWTLLDLARQFLAQFVEAKREMGMLDFHDIEQYALQLLWDSKTNRATKTAGVWRKKLRFLFVDEYQDINQAQDKIIEALGREGDKGNRFLVGDAKQSIYRFRLADPHIFQRYVESWTGAAATSIALVENFRSRKGILGFINAVFAQIMRREQGGVEYDERARLVFGGGRDEDPGGAASIPVELHLRLKGKSQEAEASEGEEEAVAEVRQADLEARFVAGRLLQLQQQQQPIWDRDKKEFRPVEWRDMAILLRSPSGKGESYAKEFARLEIPLTVIRSGFYQSLEISDLLNLLRLLDNPLQDIPTLAVLRSPLVGLNLNELGAIRMAAGGRYWNALTRWRKDWTPRPDAGAAAANEAVPVTDEDTYRKVETFLGRYSKWRRLSRQISLSHCLEAILSETHYASWLLTQPRGQQRHANVRRLLGLAQQFDQFKKQSLYRFLCFLEAQESADAQPEVAPETDSNSVRLLSIHQSKGLEFPVVVVADLGKAFNLADLKAEIILDEEFGLCPHVKPPQTTAKYPSLPYWLARERQSRELLGEETRLLYVAMTRARDHLVLTGTITQSRFEKFWTGSGESPTSLLASAKSYADWLGCWFAGAGVPGENSEGEKDSCRWKLYPDPCWADLEMPALAAVSRSMSLLTGSQADFEKLLYRLAWQYPFIPATAQAAKSSVTRLRRSAAAQEEDDAALLFPPAERRTRPMTRAIAKPGADSAAETGRLHHTFLQLVSLDRTGSVAELESEVERLIALKAFKPEEAKRLDLEAIAGFWNSRLGAEIRAQAKYVLRELPFTARFSPNELALLTGAKTESAIAADYVIVQGVADLVVRLPQELWVIDFKTDRMDQSGLAEKASLYSPQLKLYARALSGIYRRPVTRLVLYFLESRQQVAVPAELVTAVTAPTA